MGNLFANKGKCRYQAMLSLKSETYFMLFRINLLYHLVKVGIMKLYIKNMVCNRCIMVVIAASE